MNPVDIQIMGSDYRVSCPDGGEASLKAAAQVVDHAMTTIRNAGMVRSRERMAVLASINLAYDLTRLRAEVNSLRQQINQQVEDVRTDIERHATCEDLITRLDQALGEDGHLL
jgi:cell division protein ZapA